MNELVTVDQKILAELPPTYAPLIEYVQHGLPEISRATSLFNKSDSQFTNNFLTITAVTPIRNLRQILAEMKKIRNALAEAYINVKKRKIQIAQINETIRREALSGSDLDMAEAEIEEHEIHISMIMENVAGALRKLANFQQQYDDIQRVHKLEGFTEDDFEAEEEAYHITRAFMQALNAARAHGWIIDEGNQIYLEQIGINGSQAQVEIFRYLTEENEIIKSGRDLDYVRQYTWLLSMADKFKGCSKRLAELRGQSGLISDIAIVKEER